MVQPGIVQLFTIRNQGAKECAEFQQVIPVTIIAREARGIKARDEPHPRQTNVGQEALKAQTLVGRGPAFAQVVINDVHPLAWPPECHNPFDQVVLEIGTRRVAGHLAERGLADIDIGQLRLMHGRDFGREARLGAHGWPPAVLAPAACRGDEESAEPGTAQYGVGVPAPDGAKDAAVACELAGGIPGREVEAV
jgi:hypothetical protein